MFPTFEMDGNKFVMWLPQDKKREVDMQDFIMIPFSSGIWEPTTTQLVKKELREGQTAVDIGTSIGYFTNLFARQVGKRGKVVSVEQGAMQFQYMLYNVKVNGYEDRVIAYNNAAWNKTGKIELPIPQCKGRGVEVKTRAVDDILEENGIKQVDFIKIDTDGAEPWILEGLERTFQRSPNVKMVIEYYPSYIEQSGGSTKRFWEIINKYFVSERIENEYSHEVQKQHGLEKHHNLFCQRK